MTEIGNFDVMVGHEFGFNGVKTKLHQFRRVFFGIADFVIDSVYNIVFGVCICVFYLFIWHDFFYLKPIGSKDNCFLLDLHGVLEPAPEASRGGI